MSQQITPLIAKQLFINRLEILPIEIISIIKDYVFHNIEAIAKRKKNILIALFNNTQWGRYPWRFYSEEQQISDPTLYRNRFTFVLYEENCLTKSRQFQCEFCPRCGNYNADMLTYDIPIKIGCEDMCYYFRDY